MRLLAFLFLLIGAGLAGGTIYYVKIYVSTYEASLANQQAPEGPEVVRVVAAKVPLNYGDRLDYEAAKKSLKFVEWPKSAVPEGAFMSSDELFGENKQEVRIVLRKMEPGEPLLRSKVTGFGQSVRMALQVSEGMRAVTIPINAVTGGGGHISPGDRVDIEWTHDSKGQISSIIILQNVLVIATGQSQDEERSGARLAPTATVEVNPQDAQRLRLALQAGTLALLLRGVNEAPTDPGDEAPIQPVMLSDLPGMEKPEPAPTPEPEPVVVAPPSDPGYNVKVRRGITVTEETFTKDGTPATGEPATQ